MYDIMDAEYSFTCIYFIVIVVVMNFWLINLFIAVITEMFAKIREDSEGSAFTTAREKGSRIEQHLEVRLQKRCCKNWLDDP
ncbi:hypothetical protein BC938DRAFT_473379 [Jimgerdemannia flammicorona]|uniref:Ion transport domain-containing protein n=1 Tax=Jimgerdemannia flammicorona TaxID=994334 RepID=A0A433Q427_9FUNG|nr:hypothetical protein BC938DRAFT_473379 [Jimgerdemannia flammicorona]